MGLLFSSSVVVGLWSASDPSSRPESLVCSAVAEGHKRTLTGATPACVFVASEAHPTHTPGNAWALVL